MLEFGSNCHLLAGVVYLSMSFGNTNFHSLRFFSSTKTYSLELQMSMIELILNKLYLGNNDRLLFIFESCTKLK